MNSFSNIHNRLKKFGIWILVVFLIIASPAAIFASDSTDLENARQLLYLGDNLNDGKIALEQFLTDWPESELVPLARIHLANYYVKTADYNEAVTRLNDIYSDFPDHEQGRYAYHYVGTVLAQKGDITAAKQRYLDTITNFSDYNDIVYLSYRELGDMFLKDRQFQKAYDYYGQLMACPDYNDQPQSAKDKIQNDREYAFYGIAENLVEIGDSNGAEVWLQLVLSQLFYRDDLVFLANKGLAELYIDQQQYQDAVGFITAALSFPGFSGDRREYLNAHRVMAGIETEGLLDRSSLTVSEVNSVRDTLKSSYSDALVSRGLILAAERYLIPAVKNNNETQYQAGLQFLKSQLADFPNSDMGHFQYGNFAYQYGDYDTALEHFGWVSDNFGYYSACAQYRIGQIYRQKGQDALARGAFAAVIDDFPDSSLAKSAKVQLSKKK